MAKTSLDLWPWQREFKILDEVETFVLYPRDAKRAGEWYG